MPKPATHARSHPARLHHALCAALFSLLPAATLAAAPAPQRIVSLNLCPDQLLLALADRGQIAGLSRNARDPALSAAAVAAAGIPLLGDNAETVLAARPDLVLGLGNTVSGPLAPLQRYPIPRLDLGSASRFADIKAELRTLAAAIGHPNRGERLIAQMERQLGALPRPGAGRVAAYYQRRGFLTGAGTLVDELMQRAGLVNLATRLGRPALSRLSLEELVAARPDFLIVSGSDDQDLGGELLVHPALSGIPRLYLPQAWTVCGGPAYVQAAASLVAQIDRVDRQRPHSAPLP